MVSGFGFQISGFGFRVSGFGFRVSGFGFRVSVFGFQVSGFGYIQVRSLASLSLKRPCKCPLIDMAFRETRHFLICFRGWVDARGKHARAIADVSVAEEFEALGQLLRLRAPL